MKKRNSWMALFVALALVLTLTPPVFGSTVDSDGYTVVTTGY